MFKEVQQGFGSSRYVTPAKMLIDEEFHGYYMGNCIYKHNRKIHCVHQEDGEELRIASSTALDEFFDSIEVGTLFKIVFKGKVSTKSGGSFNTFKYFVSDNKLPPEQLAEIKAKMLEITAMYEAAKAVRSSMQVTKSVTPNHTKAVNPEKANKVNWDEV